MRFLFGAGLPLVTGGLITDFKERRVGQQKLL